MTNTILILNPCGCRQVCCFAEGRSARGAAGGSQEVSEHKKKKKSTLCERIAHTTLLIFTNRLGEKRREGGSTSFLGFPRLRNTMPGSEQAFPVLESQLRAAGCGCISAKPRCLSFFFLSFFCDSSASHRCSGAGREKEAVGFGSPAFLRAPLPGQASRALRPTEGARRGFVPPHILYQIRHFGVKLLSALSKGFCSVRLER